MNDLLFAVPWWIPTLLACIGIALFLNGNKRQIMPVRNLGAGFVALAILWSVVSYFVDTDKETVEKGTNQMVQAVVDGITSGDYSKFKSKLKSDVSFNAGNGIATGDDAVTRIARQGGEMAKLKSARVQDLTMDQTGTLIAVHCDIFSTQDTTPIETSSWQFDWEKTSQGWKIRDIKLISLKEIPPDQLNNTPLRSLVK
jgi:hypothetical protein